MTLALKHMLKRTAFKVLLVEDNLADAELFQEWLLDVQGLRITLIHVQCVSEALDALNQEKFDVILLDLSLRDRIGLDTLARIQDYGCQHSNGACPAIVVLTGDDDEQFALQLIRAGAQDCLVKGQVESKSLIRSLHYAIARSAAPQAVIARQDAIASIAHQQRQEALLRSEEKCSCIIPEITEVIAQTEVKQAEQESDRQAALLALAHRHISAQERSPGRREALASEEHRFFTLSLDLLCIAGVDGYFKRLNPAWETTLGYTISELLSKPFLDFVHPEDREATQCEAQKLNNCGAPSLKFENRYLCKDGSYRWLSWTAVPFYEEGLIYTVARDITQRKQAEAALLLSQERLHLALEGSDLGLWDWNISTGKTYFDPQWKRMLGYEVDEIENNYQSWERLLHPQDRPKILEGLKAYLEGRIPIFRVELRMRSARRRSATLSHSGEWQWIVCRGKVFEWDESGKPLRMTGTHKDITERKTLERELALREARLNAFFASSPIGLKILDDQLRFVQINEPLAEINGLPIHDHIGKTLREVLPDMAPVLEPLYQKVLRTGEPILNLEVSGEVPSLPGIVRHWMTSYFPIPGEEGRPCGVGAVVVEISDVYNELRLRKQAEAELHRTQQFLNSLLENLPVGVFAKDAQELRFVFWNKTLTELIGYCADQVIGKSDYDLFSEEHANFSTAQDQEAFSTGRLIDNSAEPIPTHRGQRIFHVKQIPIFDEVGRPQYILGIADDITERQQTIDRLRLLERAIAASSNGIVITDATLPDHPLVYINPGFERITGYRTEEVMGQNCRFLQGSDRDQPALTELRAALQEDRECCVVLRNYRKDGTLFWNEFSISPVRDATGNLTHYIGVHRDITQLKQAEAALKQQVLRERLVGAMRERIRRTLNLKEVLTTAVEEVRQFLQTDRTVIYRFYPDWSGVIAVESVGEDWTPLQGLEIQGNCFAQT